MFASQTEGELRVTQILKEKFPQATAIKVTDISGQVFSCLSQSLVGFCPSEGQRESRGLGRKNVPSTASQYVWLLDTWHLASASWGRGGQAETWEESCGDKSRLGGLNACWPGPGWMRSPLGSAFQSLIWLRAEPYFNFPTFF